jgi:two-component system cell cycle response regulator
MLADVELTAAIKVAQRIRLEIARTNFDVGIDGARIAVTFSMGLAMATTEDDPESLLAKADKALYQSKNRGRNQLNWYEEETAVCVSAAGV